MIIPYFGSLVMADVTQVQPRMFRDLTRSLVGIVW